MWDQLGDSSSSKARKLELRWAYADLALNGFYDVLLEHEAGVGVNTKLVNVARASVVNT